MFYIQVDIKLIFVCNILIYKVTNNYECEL